MRNQRQTEGHDKGENEILPERKRIFRPECGFRTNSIGKNHGIVAGVHLVQSCDQSNMEPWEISTEEKEEWEGQGIMGRMLRLLRAMVSKSHLRPSRRGRTAVSDASSLAEDQLGEPAQEISSVAGAARYERPMLLGKRVSLKRSQTNGALQSLQQSGGSSRRCRGC